MKKSKVKQTNKHISPKQKADMLQKIEFMRFSIGKEYKEIAAILGISQQTICNWVKAAGWRGIKVEPKQSDSLAAFQAYIRVKYPNKFPGLDKIINEYIKRF